MNNNSRTYAYDRGNAVRAIARDRIGQPPARKVEVSRLRKPIKHKKIIEDSF